MLTVVRDKHWKSGDSLENTNENILPLKMSDMHF